MRDKLLIFVKNPILGKVKTRLAKDLGTRVALAVYADLLQQTRKIAEEAQVDIELYYSDFIPEQDVWSDLNCNKNLQAPGDLGARLMKAIESQKTGKLVVIGSDCYDLSARHIQEAFQALEKNELVLGPANDGGYYLIGMKQGDSDYFKAISWSTEKVLSQTLAIANKKNSQVYLLEELIDLDTFEDLKASGYPSAKWKRHVEEN